MTPELDRNRIMKKITVIIILLLLVLVSAAIYIFTYQRGPTLIDTTAQAIETRFATSEDSTHFTVGETHLHADTLLLRFYREREFLPAWINKKGPIELADSLVSVLHDADLEDRKSVV